MERDEASLPLATARETPLPKRGRAMQASCLRGSTVSRPLAAAYASLPQAPAEYVRSCLFLFCPEPVLYFVGLFRPRHLEFFCN